VQLHCLEPAHLCTRRAVRTASWGASSPARARRPAAGGARRPAALRGGLPAAQQHQCAVRPAQPRQGAALRGPLRGRLRGPSREHTNALYGQRSRVKVRPQRGRATRMRACARRMNTRRRARADRRAPLSWRPCTGTGACSDRCRRLGQIALPPRLSHPLQNPLLVTHRLTGAAHHRKRGPRILRAGSSSMRCQPPPGAAATDG